MLLSDAMLYTEPDTRRGLSISDSRMGIGTEVNYERNDADCFRNVEKL